VSPGGELPLGLHPGSRMPRDGDEVDVLLRLVPEIAFEPELAECVLPAAALAGASPLDPAHLARLADDAYLARMRGGLARLIARAERETNGGLQFLASTLEHFADQLSPDDHPLVVALWCRSWARKRGRDDAPAAIAVAMDDYESARGSRT
jgi:hypothetical protein